MITKKDWNCRFSNSFTFKSFHDFFNFLLVLSYCATLCNCRFYPIIILNEANTLHLALNPLDRNKLITVFWVFKELQVLAGIEWCYNSMSYLITRQHLFKSIQTITRCCIAQVVNLDISGIHLNHIIINVTSLRFRSYFSKIWNADGLFCIAISTTVCCWIGHLGFFFIIGH